MGFLSALLVVLGVAGLPGRASAHGTQEAIMQDDPIVLAAPMATLLQMRLLGAQRVRLSLRWGFIAPQPGAKHRPGHFDAGNPAAYPPSSWTAYDRVVKVAQQLGIGLDFDVVGPAPVWALGPKQPKHNTNHNWRPSLPGFRSFVHAVAERYSGNYDPATGSLSPGKPSDIPAVHFWSIWNEPNYGPNLAPQGVPGHLKVPLAPMMYRRMVDAAWTSLRQTGHAGDTVLIGELAPRGKPFFGVYSGMKPLVFLRSLYCVGARYRRLRGRFAAARGCPSTAAGSRAFQSRHPGLFQASGFSDHPYSEFVGPAVETRPDPSFTSLAEIDNLAHALNRVTEAYGSSERIPIWNTEYGWVTAPPKHSPDRTTKPTQLYVSPAAGAAFDNQAEYISYRNPRIRSFAQYLLKDSLTPIVANDYGGFASGLMTYSGAEKATYAAWRMPLYLPETTARAGSALEVWGCIRPAHYAAQDLGSGAVPDAQIQFARRGSSDFSTIETMPITSADGYFDTRVSFPGSGRVRIAWTYPAGDQLLQPGREIYSRTVSINA